MAEEFVLIPGRTSRQGTSLNEGKETEAYLDEINTVLVSPEDMERLGLADGDFVRMWNDFGEVRVACRAAKKDELSPGVLFISYGDMSSRLMPGDTQGTGMPDSKGLDVRLEKAES